MVEISGLAPSRFAAVKDAFAANFDAGEELGARFALVEAGETVLDIWAGFADRGRTRPFDERTLTPIFSTTKAIAALLIARLVDAGKLDYAQTVASVWPEFAQAGKAAVTVEQVMSHQEGLPGFADQMDPALWFDWDAICAKLASMAPMWPPGTASGYHPITFGYLAGEIFRRVEGRTMAKALRQDLAEPFGLDLWIGIPDSEFDRVAELQRPNALPDFGRRNEPTRAAFLTPWAQPGGQGAAALRRLELPSATGQATALALARLMGALANDGWLDGEDILSPALIAEAARERIRGQDLVLPFEMSWGAGFMRNAAVHPWGPGDQTFGHSGWGGSCAFADPERRLAGAYVMNKQSTDLLGDRRPRRLIEAAYASL
ncbi:MAG TPA: serine hydrolase domain-containing protein [Caulobacteraceae bacterium]|jgi:CubicO group peptidase (beta-lactamase class C family)|uniref:serine hydrolase domain-containing protein n=1 Tax=Phenylobacterium sp. TaxID=1871053 RepID=UPI002C472886|nr:serine hydrolase domain-containing protein [Phenylobacterium sp.]HLZ84445.1 serine hydrolase domain-containing protein [Caulobacteraceae bacterium]HXA39063.1 serine hydrolase domain-containing protein [Phenylobacterium sp.]